MVADWMICGISGIDDQNEFMFIGMKKFSIIKYMVLAMAVAQGSMDAVAQHQELTGKPELWKGRENKPEDSRSLLHAFKNGQVHGHFRYYFMATNNKPGLTDYYANALGGGIKYETAPFRGFQLGVSGFFVFNIGSFDFSKPDPSTGQINRYEIGLFDVGDPSNKDDIDRLEELYLKYNWKKSHITLGKQLINTPFINLQDGRMRPTEVGGVYGEINDFRNTKIEGGFFYEISPRSTVRWYSIGESIGIYPVGVNLDGSKSDHKGNLESNGIAMLGLSHKFSKKFSAQLYNLYVENIFNSALLQADFTYPLHDSAKLVAGLQYIRQDAIREGGNADPSKTYFTKGGMSQSFGAKLGWEKKRWQASLNYNRITADGRYLMPREWGRDPFFTFMPRERNEGLGDVHAVVVKAGYSIPKLRLKTQAGFGYFDLPEVTNFALNKYGLPSYTQLNIDVRHAFAGLLKGLEAQLLLVYKGKLGNSYDNNKYVINKVDMSLYHLVLNYHF
jgi:hypothetical protein